MKHGRLVCVGVAAVSVAMLVAVGTANGNFKGNNGLIAFDSWTGSSQDIGVFDPNGTGTPTFLANRTDMNEQTPRWSRDGKKIVYMARLDPFGATNYDIWVMDADGSNKVNVTNTPNVDEEVPAWTADGRIVYCGSAPNNADKYDVYLMNADGSGLKALTNADAATSFACWPSPAPNGNKLAFTLTSGGSPEIWTMTLDGKGLRKVTTGRESDWSPSGNDLVFVRTSTGSDRDVWMIHSDGTGERRLTNTPTQKESFPTWSPDGTTVDFGRVVRSGVYNIFSVDLATGSEQLLLADAPLGTPTTYSVAYPTWQPLGKP